MFTRVHVAPSPAGVPCRVQDFPSRTPGHHCGAAELTVGSPPPPSPPRSTHRTPPRPAAGQHSHLIEEHFVLLVPAATFHLVVQLGDDLVFEL